MPRLTFEYSREAVHEAHQAFHWYDDQNPVAAQRFWQELKRARALVTEHPETWTPYFHNTRVFRLRKFPYGLVYTVRGDLVIGIAVCHLKQRPGYWRKRVAP